ncbi:hypothetical protein CDA63_05705 [Hymenobacter amundsenii]|uniref:Uncharacterized protein n=1 Tax=Hymenobacter amundsenii TaxID=2006685 RepID=A0A246FMJ6_9BACT|nr:hypothetical protein [Hymenobacter amundsenii]OWP63961.1 hypothetical protein CDA63_05705 [Hymenobacter amundsenii]
MKAHKEKYITSSSIEEFLQGLLNHQTSREEASQWALNSREGLERRALKYFPASAESKIWDAVLFIEGIDLQDAPGSYLHNEEDIRLFLDQFSA